MTTNGQAPFITVFMDINEVPEGKTRDDLALVIEEVLVQRIQGVKNESGVWITPAFPKLIYALDENNVKPGTEYFYLTELSAKCTAKRMVPDYISRKLMLDLKGDVYTCMGCRSFLTPDRFTDAGVTNIAKAKNYVEGKHKYYGRFNQGVVTINLVDVALSSGGDLDRFWNILDERLELCHRALQLRHKRLEGTPSDVAPILWQYGALARLDKGETIDKLLHDGYSTISLGYAGLYECTKYMTGHSHTGGGKDFALELMRKLNDYCNKWKAEENIDYSLYGTPIESTTYKFAKCLQNRFGIIEGVTDKNYITNSYHVHVTEEIDAFTKLKFESEFQALSPGGAISYVEVPNMQDNIEAVLAVIEFIYENIMYAELNTKSDYCQVCGYDGEILIVEDDKKLVWECPNCGNRDNDKMNIARRTCGYIGTNTWNQGRVQEIKERVLHL
jgi:ribonucleoside-triphosphate reductase